MGWFDWLKPIPECPIDPATRTWLDGRWAWLEGQFGAERPLRNPVVLPRPEFFPDPYRQRIEDLPAMLVRVSGYMGVDPSSISVSVFDNDPNDSESRAAGLYFQDETGHHIAVVRDDLRTPLAPVGTLAHELGHVILLGQGRISREAEDHEPLTDLLTVYFGMGIFSANSAYREGRWERVWRGYMPPETYGYALARFARSRKEDRPKWARHLCLDVRWPFQTAMRFLAAEDAGLDTAPFRGLSGLR